MNKGKELIFLVSQPRAGSTLLQNILSNNKDVVTTNESWIFLLFAPILNPSLTLTKYEYNLAFFQLKNFEKEYPSFNSKDLIRNTINSFYNQIKGDTTKKIVLDKTPRYYEILFEIQKIYPEAKFVLLKRNPQDVVYSLIKKRKINTANDLAWNYRDLLYAPKKIEDFITANKDSKNVYSVTYEDLIDSPENGVKKLYENLGISYTSEVLSLKNNEQYKGSLGDKNLNSSVSFSEIKQKVQKPNLNSELKMFLQGYLHYLGSDFLKDYGYETFDFELKETKIFKEYLSVSKNTEETFNNHLFNKFNNIR